MGIAGSISPPGGAPKPDPARVATLRYTIVDEPETCAAFGESARATLVSLNDRALAETRNGDLGECALLLDHVRDRLGGLDPARLQPRTGLAGLFDSKGKRLKEFRAAWTSAAASVTQSASEIGDRAGALARKSTALETLWSETRNAIAEVDAHIAAARGWLANEAPHAPAAPVAETHEAGEAPVDAEIHASAVETTTEAEIVEIMEEIAETVPVENASEADAVVVPEAEDTSASQASTEAVVPVEEEPAAGPVLAEAADVPESESAPEASSEVEMEASAESRTDPLPLPELTPVASLPHPLETRLAALEAVRATAIGRLPLMRAAQNADCRAPSLLKQVCDGVEVWRAEWQDALGLSGKRPRKVNPDRVRLDTASTTLSGYIDSAGRELSAAQARRAELDARAIPRQAPAQMAA